MKTFRGALVEFEGWLKARRPFAFSRFGDGELAILQERPKRHPEFRYEPADPAYVFLRERLLESFRYRSENYYVGISCPTCIGADRFAWAKQTSGQPERQLTWATLFVNSNYPYFKEQIVPVFAGYRAVLICNRMAKLDGLPFSVHRDFRIGNNAWRDNYHLAHQVAEYIVRDKVEGALFLLCAGPFSNILAHKLHAASKHNTYLDVGSTLDPLLFGSRGMTRKYLRGEKKFLEKTCIWQ